MRRLITALIAVLTLLYPVAVYFSIQTVAPWQVASLLLLLIISRFFISQQMQWGWIFTAIGVVYCGIAIWQNNLVSLRFYPVLMSFSFFIVFISSLKWSPPIVERIARLQHPDLPPEGVKYTYKVTVVWSLFFLLNGLIACYTALYASFKWWSLYNGLISYVLMGILMGSEYLIRRKTQAHVH